MKRLWFLVPVAAALALTAGPVGARTTKTACGPKSACVWTEPTFQGRMAQVPGRGCIDSSIRSAVNNSGRTIYLFMGSGCYGPRAGTLQPGQETPEISAGSATGNCTTPAGDPCGDDATSPPEPPT